MIAYLNNNKLRNVHFHKSGGGDLVTDWAKLNYKDIPSTIDDAYNYALNIYNNWDASIGNRANAFGNDKNLFYFPAVDTSKVTTMLDMFANSNLQVVPVLDISNVTTMQHTFGNTLITEFNLGNYDTTNVTTMYALFRNCGQLKTLDLRGCNLKKVTSMQEFVEGCKNLTTIYCENLDIPNVTNMQSMFEGCSGLTSLNLANWNTSNVTNLGTCFASCNNLKTINISGWDTSKVTSWYYSLNSLFEGCSGLTRVDGYFDYTSTSKNGYSATYAFRRCSALRRFEVRNMGKHQELTQCYFIGNYDGMKLWGEDTEEIPDARQSMINTLITYSFDRASAGYSNCTITLHANAKARLTDDEIAQITAKGFTIA